MIIEERKITGLALAIFTLASMFYLYEFILQVSPGVMTQGLMRDFNVGAAGVGLISAAYFYGYTPMQIPAGLLYDRFGPRELLTFAIAICVLGTWFFIASDSRLLAALGRFCMGIGSAFSFIGALVLASRWFPARYYAVMVGFAQLLSSVGAILGEGPLAASVDSIGWRSTLLFVSLVGVVLTFAVALVVRNYPRGMEPVVGLDKKTPSLWSNLQKVTEKRQTWACAAFAFFVWGPVTVFAALWGNQFLMTAQNLTITQASWAVAVVWVGIGVGSVIFGWWSDIMGRRVPSLHIAALLGLFSSTAIIFFPHMPDVLMHLCLFLFGVGASGHVITFAIVKESNPRAQMGTATGINNMATVAGGAILQPFCSYLISYFWLGEMQGNMPVYHMGAYQKALVAIPLCYMVAYLLSVFYIKETYCESQM